MKAIELLAPAGSRESLYAAVTAGADAVYLGAGSFNARRGAENFSLETLAEACDYAHLRGVSVYLTLNTAILPDEIAEAMELVRQAYRCGVDAFIVQDIGIASEMKRTLPEANLHISTQMNMHNIDGLQAAAALGAKRVTLARELSLAEIGHLCQAAEDLGLEVETFVHGALCICYSGQCFMSSMIGGRSANRGLCAQACRLPYTLHNRALKKTLPAEGDHLLSPKDLRAAELLPSLVEAGVTSFKIEGRMKSADYVHAVTAVYRSILDSLQPAAGDRHILAPEQSQALDEAFSRGFTTAYLEGERGNGMMSYAKPNNRGIFIGRVASVAKDGAQATPIAAIAPEYELNAGDVLEIWTNKGRITAVVEHPAPNAKGVVEVVAKQMVGKGDRVFRVRNAKAGFEPDPLEPRIPLKGKAVLRHGEPLQVEFAVAADEAPRNGSAQRDRFPHASAKATGAPIEEARTKAVTAEEVREHIDRLGSVPFKLISLEVELDEGVGIGFSALHKVRAQALKSLEENLLAEYSDRKLPRISERPTHAIAPQKGCEVVVWATNPACARAAKREGADALFVPALNYKRGEGMVAGQVSETVEQAGYPKQVAVALPTVQHDLVPGTREASLGFDAWAYVKPGKPVLVESLGQLIHAVGLGAVPELGPHVPVANPLSLQAAAEFGAQRVWLSPELSLSQIEALGSGTPVPLGLTILGAQELMVTEHCLLMSQGPCNQRCAECARRKSPHYLKDRKGYEFPVVTDIMGRTHLYNAIELDIAHTAPELVKAGVTALMVDTTLMNVAETTAAVRRAVRARDIALKSGDSVSKKEGATSGHLFRGVK